VWREGQHQSQELPQLWCESAEENITFYLVNSAFHNFCCVHRQPDSKYVNLTLYRPEVRISRKQFGIFKLSELVGNGTEETSMEHINIER
jgi:hypothetical protein